MDDGKIIKASATGERLCLFQVMNEQRNHCHIPGICEICVQRLSTSARYSLHSERSKASRCARYRKSRDRLFFYASGKAVANLLYPREPRHRSWHVCSLCLHGDHVQFGFRKASPSQSSLSPILHSLFRQSLRSPTKRPSPSCRFDSSRCARPFIPYVQQP